MVRVARVPGFGAAEDLDCFLRRKQASTCSSAVEIMRGSRVVVHPSFDDFAMA